MIIVLFVLGFAYLVLCTLRPQWGFGLILAALPAYAIRFDVFSIPTTVLEIMVGIFLLSVLVSHWRWESWQRITSLKRINWVVGFFVAAGIISVFVSPEPARALGQLKAFIFEPVLLFYAAVVVFKSENDFRTPLKLLFWSAAIISVFGLIQYYTHILLPLRFWGYGEEVKRITSVFEYPNALALYLAPLFLFFTSLHTKGWLYKSTVWPLTGLVAMVTALVLTYSRGAWLAILVGLVVLALQQSKISLKKWGVVGIIVLLAISPVITSRVKQTFQDKSSSERISLINAASAKLTKNPIFGNGLFGFRATLENSNYSGEILNYPHNIIFNFWLEMGIIGLLAFLSLLYLAAQYYIGQPSQLSLAACMFMLVMVVHGLVDVPYFKNDLSILFWFMLSAMVIRTIPNTKK
jgi:O-antigen ligase